MRIGARKLLWMGPCEKMGSASRRRLAHRKVEVEAAAGGSSRQERLCLALALFMEVHDLEVG